MEKSQIEEDKRDESCEILEIVEQRILDLSYRDLRTADNLGYFVHLTELRLNNNSLTEFTDFKTLQNLEVLNLSFNELKKPPEGLEVLKKLHTLLLFKNKITDLSNILQVTSLEIVSAGKNNITSLDSIKALRKLRNLKSLNIADNPCWKDESRLQILAHLPELIYLNHHLISNGDKEKAHDQFQDQLAQILEQESIQERKDLEDKKYNEYLCKVQQASLETIERLFDSIFVDDPILEKFEPLEGFLETKNSFSKEFSNHKDQVIPAGLELHSETEKEKAIFFKKISELRQQYEGDLRATNKKIEMLKESLIDNLEDGKLSLDKVTQKFSSEMHEFSETITQIATDQLDRSLSLVSELETRLKQNRVSRLEKNQDFFRVMEDLESSWVEAVDDLIEQATKDPEDTPTFLVDREFAQGLLQASHDLHVERILALEDKMRETLNQYFDSYTSNQVKESTKLHREALLEYSRINQDALAALTNTQPNES